MKSLLILLTLAFSAPVLAAPPDAGVNSSGYDEALTELLRKAGAYDNPNFQPNWPVVLEHLKAQQNTGAQYRLLGAVVLAFLLKRAIDFLLKLRSPRPEVKKALPLILAVLGAIVAVVDAWVNGTPWTSAVVLGLAAPGAVIVNEVGNALRRNLEESAPPAQPATVAAPPPPPPPHT